MLFRSVPSGEPTAPNPPARTFDARLLILLFAAWIIPGLIGHDPWKPDEAYSFGLIYHILQSGDWVVPTLAGEPFMEKPPLYYLVAALFAKIFSPVLPLHDGARLASGFFMGLTFLFTGLGARELLGKDKSWLAPLVLLGCLGLLIRTHQTLTDVGLLSGFAIGLYGLARCLRSPVAGGIWLGTGIGVGFMSKGLIAPGMLGIIALCLPLFEPWRKRNYLLTLLLALVAVAPWLLIWPLALYQRSPELFMEWFWINNFGRFLGLVNLGPAAEPLFYLQILPWYAWPALPLALWMLWVERVRGWSRPGIQLPVTAFAVMLSVLMFAADAREVYALPLLLPLSLLAAGGIDSLRRGAANALYWFGLMGFTFFAIVGWFYWVALELGVPDRLFRHLHEMQPGYPPGFRTTGFTLALIYCIGWIVLLLRLKHRPERPLIIWAAGITLVWGMLATLFVGWLDTGKSYRSMIASMTQSLPPHYRCIDSLNLGEPQRAMLHYYAEIFTRRIDTASAGQCDLFLVQGTTKAPSAPPSPQWRQIWEGARPGDTVERYWLYQRN